MEREIQNIELRLLTSEDYTELRTVMVDAYTNMQGSVLGESHIDNLIEKFPDGQVVIIVNGQLAGCALSIVVDDDSFDDNHTYKDITGNFSFDTHRAKGDVLYGIDVFIKPDFRGLRLGRRLYDYRKELCEKMNLRGIAFGGRIPNYHKYAQELTPKEYIEKVRRREIHDPVLNFQISNDFHPTRVLKGYLEGDSASGEFAVLLEWDNIYYEHTKRFTKKKSGTLGISSMADAALQELRRPNAAGRILC